MLTKMTSKGQTVVPASLRRKYGVGKGTRLEWIDTGELFKVIPIPANVVKALRGSARGEKLTGKLLRARKEDKNFE